MTAREELEMYYLAYQLERLTRGTGWPAMQYEAIGKVMDKLATYCKPSEKTNAVHNN